MTGVRIEDIAWGTPKWPEIEVSVWEALQDEACSPTTPAERLVEMTVHWPGYQVRHLLMANPNLPQEQVIALATRFPRAFLLNPALPLWFVADPDWLPPDVARDVLKCAQRERDWPALAEQYAALVALLERCAGLRS